MVGGTIMWLWYDCHWMVCIVHVIFMWLLVGKASKWWVFYLHGKMLELFLLLSIWLSCDLYFQLCFSTGGPRVQSCWWDGWLTIFPTSFSLVFSFSTITCLPCPSSSCYWLLSVSMVFTGSPAANGVCVFVWMLCWRKRHHQCWYEWWLMSNSLQDDVNVFCA